MAELAVMALSAAGVGASTASTIGTVLSVGLTAAGAFGSLQAGEVQSQSLNIQARQAGLNSRIEQLEGKRQAARLQEQLNKDLASQNALFASRGILEGEGSALAAREAAKENATKDIDLARFNADIASLSSDQRAANLRSDAKAAKTQGRIGAVKAVSGFKRIPLVNEKP